MIVSFAWTTPALIAGRKTVTRRDWTPQHAAKFHTGQVVDAWDKSPRFGGKPVATIQIISVTHEPMRMMPDSDYEAEGFAYLHATSDGAPNHMKIDTSPAGFDQWRQSGGNKYVVRFKLLDVLA